MIKRIRKFNMTIKDFKEFNCPICCMAKKGMGLFIPFKEGEGSVAICEHCWKNIGSEIFNTQQALVAAMEMLKKEEAKNEKNTLPRIRATKKTRREKSPLVVSGKRRNKG